MTEEEYDQLLGIMGGLIRYFAADKNQQSKVVDELAVADNKLRALIRSKQSDLK